MEIPKIIHQSHKGPESTIPERELKIRSKLLMNHADWEYKYWTDEDNRKLITDHYPWFLKTYDQYAYPIQRADVARYFYMHKYGGVYLDLDMFSLQPMDELFQRINDNEAQFLVNVTGHKSVVLFEEYPIAYGAQKSIYNAILASERGADFWMLCFYMLAQEQKLQNYEDIGMENTVFRTTGPRFLHSAANAHINMSYLKNLCILPYFYTNPVCLRVKGSDNQLVLFNKYNIKSLFQKANLDGGWLLVPKDYQTKELLADSYFMHLSARTWSHER